MGDWELVWPNLIRQNIVPHNSVFKEIFGHLGQDPSVSKSNHLHVVMFRFFYIDLSHVS